MFIPFDRYTQWFIFENHLPDTIGMIDYFVWIYHKWPREDRTLFAPNIVCGAISSRGNRLPFQPKPRHIPLYGPHSFGLFPGCQE